MNRSIKKRELVCIGVSEQVVRQAGLLALIQLPKVIVTSLVDWPGARLSCLGPETQDDTVAHNHIIPAIIINIFREIQSYDRSSNIQTVSLLNESKCFIIFKQ